MVTFLFSVHTITEATQYAGLSRTEPGRWIFQKVIWPGAAPPLKIKMVDTHKTDQRHTSVCLRPLPRRIRSRKDSDLKSAWLPKFSGTFLSGNILSVIKLSWRSDHHCGNMSCLAMLKNHSKNSHTRIQTQMTFRVLFNQLLLLLLSNPLLFLSQQDYFITCPRVHFW